MLVFPTFFVTAKPQFHTPRMSQASLGCIVNLAILAVAGRNEARGKPGIEPFPVMTSVAPRGLWVG